MTDALRKRLAIVCNAYLALSVACGIVRKFATLGVGGTLAYYTQCSNLFAAVVGVVFIVVALRGTQGKAARVVFMLRYFATCCLTITFCVSLFVLSPYPESGGLVGMFFTPVRFTMHLTSPVLCLLSFVLFERWAGWGHPLSIRDAAASLIPSLAYAAVLYPLNALAMVRGPYPFLLVREMPLWQTMLWFVALIVAFFLIGLMIRGLFAAGRKKTTTRRNGS